MGRDSCQYTKVYPASIPPIELFLKNNSNLFQQPSLVKNGIGLL